MPKRIQRKRIKGWRMPEGAIYVGRPTKWGNPYREGIPEHYMTTMGVVSAFEFYAIERLRKEPRWLDELRGHDLACYCRPSKPCHADILLDISNK